MMIASLNKSNNKEIDSLLIPSKKIRSSVKESQLAFVTELRKSCFVMKLICTNLFNVPPNKA